MHFEETLIRPFTGPYKVRAAIVLKLAKLRKVEKTSFRLPPTAPLKRGGFQTPPLPQLIKEVWILNASPSPFRPKRRESPLPLPSGQKGGRD